LVTRAETKADRQARLDGESAMSPTTQLSRKPPPALKGHKLASATYTRIVKLYFEVDGVIVTAFDQDLVIKYALLEEELVDLAKQRDELRKAYNDALKAANKIKPNPDALKDYVAMWSTVNGLSARAQGLDARLDGKRKLLLAISQSLYLTPRSRAGVAPPTKPPAEEPDPMEDLL
jgi:hypothetical protein